MANTGDLISFRYNKIGATDNAPVVIVIAPLYNGMLHGINVKYLQPGNERRLMMAVVDEQYRKRPEIQNLLRMYPIGQALQSQNIELAYGNPQMFYRMYIKPVMTSNSYRMYRPALMSGVRTLQDKAAILTSMRRH